MTIYNNPPERQPALPSGATDTRYFDLTQDLQPLGALVSSIISITAARYDGSAALTGDLTILSDPGVWISASTTNTAIAATGYVVNWWETANLAVAQDFLIKITVATTDGRTLPYSCYQLVSPTVG